MKTEANTDEPESVTLLFNVFCVNHDTRVFGLKSDLDEATGTIFKVFGMTRSPTRDFAHSRETLHQLSYRVRYMFM